EVFLQRRAHEACLETVGWKVPVYPLTEFVCRICGEFKRLSQGRVGGKMFGRRKLRNQVPGLYATRSEFRRIFEKDMNSLYLLSFLLTGDRTIAQQCFVGGLHSAQNGNQVFKEWAEFWARRAIIQNAFVMSGLERYSEQECSLLLGCTRGDVAEARTRSLERLGRFADLHRKFVSIGGYQKTRRDDSGSEPQFTAAPSLAASA